MVKKKSKEKEEVEPQPGDILNYTKDVRTYVVDEEGKAIEVNEKNRDLILAKILSLLIKEEKNG